MHSRPDLLLKQEEEIYRELGNKEGLARSLGNQALMLQNVGDLEAALGLRKEEEDIFQELGNKEGLAISLINQASILQRMPGRIRVARSLADEAFELASTHGYVVLSGKIQAIRDSMGKNAN